MNVTDHRGNTPLHISVRSRYDKNTLLLLENGANPNASSHTARTPLHRASSKGSVRLLLQYGANPFILMPSGANSRAKHQSVMKHLLKQQPQACMELFDHGITTNGQPIDSDNLLVIFDYEMFYQEGVINSSSMSSSNLEHPPAMKPLAQKTCDEMAVHRAILKYDVGDILKHPLSESFLHIKWQLTKKVPYANLLSVALFVFTLTALAVYETYLSKCVDEDINVSGTQK